MMIKGKQDQDSKFDYNSINAGYYDLIYKRNGGVRSKWHHLRFARLRKEIQGCFKHLDIGCGPGTFIGSLPEDKYSIGVDVAQNQIDYAQCHYATAHHQFRCIENNGVLPFSDNSFDMVTFTEAIEHLTKNDAFFLLKEIHRVLNPETGRILITSPNYYFIYKIVEWLRDRIAKVSYKEQHITYYNRSSLADLLSQAGFVGIKINTYQFTAALWAKFNWGLADIIDKIESKLLIKNSGLLLLGIAYKEKRK